MLAALFFENRFEYENNNDLYGTSEVDYDGSGTGPDEDLENYSDFSEEECV